MFVNMDDKNNILKNKQYNGNSSFTIENSVYVFMIKTINMKGYVLRNYVKGIFLSTSGAFSRVASR